MKGLLNLTPHDITVFKENGEKVVIPSSGTLRLAEEVLGTEEVEGVECVRKRFTGVDITVDGITADGVRVIVVSGISGMMFALSSEFRNELFRKLGGEVSIIAPDTGPQSVIKDEKGRIVGVRRFCRYEVG